MNPNFVQRADLKSIAGPDHRRRAVFLDDRRTQLVEAGFQCVAVKDLRIYPATSATEIDSPFMRGLRPDSCARQAPYVRPLEAGESGKMKRLKFGRCLGIGMAVAPPVIVFECVADGHRVFQSRDRDFYVVSLAAVTHLSVALEKNVAGAEFGFEGCEQISFHRAEDFGEGADGIVIKQPDEGF